MFRNLITDKGNILFSPTRGRHYGIDRFNTIDREIYLGPNDPTPRLPLFLFPILEGITEFPFKWKELIPETEAELKNLSPLLTYETNIKEAGEANDKKGVQKMAFVERYNATQRFLVGNEVHPFYMDVITSDGIPVRLIFTFMIKVRTNGLKKILSFYPLGNFLDVAETDLIEALGCELRDKPLSELRKIATGGIKAKIDTIKKDLNRKFGKEGFLLVNTGLKAILTTPELAARIASENAIIISKNEAKAIAARSEGEAQAIENKGKAEVLVLGKKLTEQAKYEEAVRKLVDQTKVKVATNLKATTLVTENLFGENKAFKDLLVANTVTKGGANNGN